MSFLRTRFINTHLKRRVVVPVIDHRYSSNVFGQSIKLSSEGDRAREADVAFRKQATNSCLTDRAGLQRRRLAPGRTSRARRGRLGVGLWLPLGRWALSRAEGGAAVVFR